MTCPLSSKKMAAEIDHIGLAIQSNKDYHKNYDWLSDLDILKAKVDALEDSGSHLVLKKILVNLRQIGENDRWASGLFLIQTGPSPAYAR